jgi:3-phenylpropionate/trans-cinnamate dioxygenase ferredoxin reductase component
VPETFVIVGAGLAGAKAAETLRAEGFGGRIVLVGAEPELPYERPPLSKKYLAGAAGREDAEVHPRGFYVDHEIDLVAGALATGLDVNAHRVTLADSRFFEYDRLLIATGAVPRRPPIPGAEDALVLRTLADAEALRARLRPGSSVAIVGAGWIGCEVAAAARTLGAEVTLIEQGEVPLERVLGRELGAMYGELHRERGVDLRTGESSRGPIEADTVLVAVGVGPDTRLAEAGGLAIDDGVLVDELLRTSDPDVFAAGDVANALHPRYARHVRVEHWANALNQGVAAARSMLDLGEPYARLPYFFSDQYDVGMEYVGLHDPTTDRLVVEGRLADRQFRAFWVDAEDRVTAGMHVNDWDDGIEPIKRAVEAGAPLQASVERT